MSLSEIRAKIWGRAQPPCEFRSAQVLDQNCAASLDDTLGVGLTHQHFVMGLA